MSNSKAETFDSALRVSVQVSATSGLPDSAVTRKPAQTAIIPGADTVIEFGRLFADLSRRDVPDRPSRPIHVAVRALVLAFFLALIGVTMAPEAHATGDWAAKKRALKKMRKSFS